MRNLNTRGLITVVVLLAVLPALALTIYGAFDQRAAAEAEARENLNRLARLAARQQGQIVEGARQTLVAISQILPKLHRDRPACSEYFTNLLEKSSGLYHSMGLYGADGELVCNAVPWQGRVDGSDRLFFRQALATRMFAVGEYQLGQVTKREGINFGHPVTDASGKVTAVAFIGLNLDSFNRIAASTPLPKQGAVTIIDRNGTILARHPALAEAVGSRLVDVVRVPEAAFAGAGGLFEAGGADGVARLYAHEAVISYPDGSFPLRVLVSIPLREIYAEATETLVRNLVGLLIATVLLLAVAWYGTDRLVLRRIRKLLEAARRVRAGDLSARVGLHDEKDELSQLGMAFDAMAEALQRRDQELKQAMQDLREQSITDPLTGLYNRRYLLELLPRELMRARRSARRLGAIMVDLDYFKRVNDDFGHEAGDLVLRALGRLLKENIRGSDTAWRYGGEEFLLILPEATIEGAVQRAEAIRAAVKRLDLRHLDRALGPITASFGLALYPDHAADVDGLLRAADEALYRAKDAGRDRVIVSDAESSQEPATALRQSK